MIDRRSFERAPEFFLRTLRTLVETHGRVMAVSDRHCEALGLTPAQFDVLATLGENPPMSCRELGEETLITKGTLTGVLDRLEIKGLIRRVRAEKDSRQIMVSLTPDGEVQFRRAFQPHVDYLSRYFAGMPIDRQRKLVALMEELQSGFAESAVRP